MKRGVRMNARRNVGRNEEMKVSDEEMGEVFETT